jgi:hypothetical protein
MVRISKFSIASKRSQSSFWNRWSGSRGWSSINRNEREGDTHGTQDSITTGPVELETEMVNLGGRGRNSPIEV